MKRIITISTFVAAAALSTAIVTYDNMGGTNSFSNSNTTSVGETSIFPANSYRRSQAWVATQTGLLNTIEVPLSHNQNDTEIIVQLYADVAGEPDPGAPLLFWQFNNTFSTGTIRTLLGLNLVTINAGQQYWLEMHTPNTGGQLWHMAAPSTMGGVRVSNNNDLDRSWEYAGNGFQGGLKVTVNPVPEPATMIALGLGAAALMRRRKK